MGSCFATALHSSKAGMNGQRPLVGTAQKWNHLRQRTNAASLMGRTWIIGAFFTFWGCCFFKWIIGCSEGLSWRVLKSIYLYELIAQDGLWKSLTQHTFNSNFGDSWLSGSPPSVADAKCCHLMGYPLLLYRYTPEFPSRVITSVNTVFLLFMMLKWPLLGTRLKIKTKKKPSKQNEMNPFNTPNHLSI